MGDLEEFVDTLFGEYTGYVYAPTKLPSREKSWDKRAFKWPEQRLNLLEYIRSKTATHEVYISPSLFKEDISRAKVQISKENWKGSRLLWAEFDNGVPDTDTLPVPAPSIRLRSSTADKEHWYWILPYFGQDPDRTEDLNKRIAYALGADKSGWDFQQVLRPPGTVNHKYSETTTELLSIDTGAVSVGPFIELPEPPPTADLEDLDVANLPKMYEVLAENTWDEDLLDLVFEKTPAASKVSDSMFRLASDACQAGLSNREIVSLLLAVDNKWGKFKGRNDRAKRLKGIVANARSLAGPSHKDDSATALYGLRSLLQLDLHVDWLIDGFLQKDDIALCVAKGNVGKTQFTLQLAIHLALGKPFLHYAIDKPSVVVFCSLEMGKVTIRDLLATMAMALSVDEIDKLEENLKIYVPDEPMFLTKGDQLAKLSKFISDTGAVGVFIDSLGYTVTEKLTDDVAMIKLFLSVKYHIVDKLHAFVWFIHHNRKATVGNMKPKSQDDIFGSQYIYSSSTMVVGLWVDDPENSDCPIEVSCLKMKSAKKFPRYHVRRGEFLQFEPAVTLQSIFSASVAPVSKPERKAVTQDVNTNVSESHIDI